ncbi:MAG: hypothetical protein OIF47_00730 [Marinibacterium sp.]|nr:hypothetical protein [Marinibacterium sp.]
MTIAETIVALARLWLIAGAGVAALFLTIGIDQIDEDARGAYVFRPLLIPGVMLIWPLVIWRWWVLRRGRDDWHRRYAPPRRAHLLVAVMLGLTICATLGAAFVIRQTPPLDIAPQRLTLPEDAS